MVTVELVVGNKEINAGVGGSCTQCPIALAGIKAGLHLPFVSGEFSFLTPDCERSYVSLPRNAGPFMDAFDDYMKGAEGSTKPKPIKVRFRITNSIAKLLNIKRRYIVA